MTHPLHQKCHNHSIENDNSCFKILRNKWVSYKPLVIILIYCGLISFAQKYFLAQGNELAMYSFMGYFFIFLSLFKFFDLKGFVKGFSTYDLITQKYKLYGYLYPFIELFLGIAYLVTIEPFLINFITVFVMTISGIGIIRSLLSGAKIKCACLGTVLNVPLSTVSIIENFGMGAMAAYKLIQG